MSVLVFLLRAFLEIYFARNFQPRFLVSFLLFYYCIVFYPIQRHSFDNYFHDLNIYSNEAKCKA